MVANDSRLEPRLPIDAKADEHAELEPKQSRTDDMGHRAVRSESISSADGVPPLAISWIAVIRGPMPS